MREHGTLGPVFKTFILYAAAFTVAFLFSISVLVGYGAFLDPIEPPPTADPALLQVIDTGPTYQEKEGDIIADNLWIRSKGRWATQTFTQIKKAMVFTGDFTASASVYCDPGYTLVGCSGSMSPWGVYSCTGSGNEKERCGFIGVIPIDPAGARATSTATGCKAAADGEGGNTVALVYAYCMKAGF